MREIKFRAWYKPTKVMGEPETIQEMTSYTPSLDLDDRFILMQYTGLKDKNGKEIYEGDILAYRSDYEYGLPREHRHIVQWGFWENNGEYEERKGGYGWYMHQYSVIPNNDYPIDLLVVFIGEDNDYWNIADKFEIIGNIYETPELLEVESKSG
jgi:hypothetical protein